MTTEQKIIKKRVSEEVEQALLEFAIEQLAYGQLCGSNELKKRGHS